MYSPTEITRALESVGLVEGLPYEELYVRLEIGMRLGDTGRATVAFLLADLDERSASVPASHSTAVDYAMKQLDMSRTTARDTIRVGRKLKELPLVAKAFCDQDLGWSRVLEILKVCSPEHEARWVQEARDSTFKALRATVRRSPKDGPPLAPADCRGTPQQLTKLVFRVDEHEDEYVRSACRKHEDETGEAVTSKDLLMMAADMILSTEVDGTVPGRKRVRSSKYVLHVTQVGEDGPLLLDTKDGPVPIPEEEAVLIREEAVRVDEEGRVIRDDTTPEWLRSQVLRRDKERCRCCGRYHGIQVHHIWFLEHGGPTRGWNLAAVCRRCHSLIHQGRIRVSGTTQHQAAFLDKDGKPLEREGPFVHPRALVRLQLDRKDRPLTRSHVPTAQHVPKARHAPQNTRVEDVEKVAFGEAFRRIVGCDAEVEKLKAASEGTAARAKPHPHTLFTGPPGTGKTSMARAVARTAGTRLIRAVGKEIADPRAIREILSSLKENDVVFIDEVHAVPASGMELLYDAMQGGGVPFTLLAATTKEDRLDDALISRFALTLQLGFYEKTALADIVKARADEDGIRVKDGAALEIAEAARGGPRRALHLLDRCLDEQARTKRTVLDVRTVRDALRTDGYDREGLTPDEHRYMEVVKQQGPISLSQIARLLGKSKDAVENRIEASLLRLGLVQITVEGRQVRGPRITRARIPGRGKNGIPFRALPHDSGGFFARLRSFLLM